MFPTVTSVARRFPPRKSRGRVLNRPVITVHRRDGGTHYIAPNDPRVTLFPTRDGAEWLAEFLG